METAPIPFVDLISVHRALEPELVAVFRAALETAAFVGGPQVAEFEREFAAFCAVRFCVGVASGTDALRLALVAAGVRPGDVVVTVPLTFIATAEAITQAGATPEFVDVDPRTLTMDPALLRMYLERDCAYDARLGRAVSRRTGGPVTAVVPVHLYGQMADMDAITETAAQYNLAIIEDACQAHGAEYRSRTHGEWRRAGSVGRAAAFSFYPGKNLGACGEAGAVTTDDEGIAQQCRLLRDHGQSRKYVHEVEGYNGRLDAVQAGILRVKLRRLEEWNRLRRECAGRYDAMLAEGEPTIATVRVPDWSRPVYHLYVVRVPDRDAVQEDLAAAGIGTGIHYPVPLHRSPAYARLGYREGDFPVAEHAAAQVLSLPIFPELSPAQQERVVARLLESVGARAPVVLSTGTSR
jgi:dTDP-4-amino-4,6-dideoxygalactose transaminase